MLTKLCSQIRSLSHHVYQLSKKESHSEPRYRVLRIRKNKHDEYITKVQVINKGIVFNATPEEILADDDLINYFSQAHVRGLTYLGYLSMHSPQYKILAQRSSKDQDKMAFALKKKGETNVVLKTVDDIAQDKTIIQQMSAQDAHYVGYTTAMESIRSENAQKDGVLPEE